MACLHAISGLRSRRGEKDEPGRSLAQYVSQALGGAVRFHEFESFLAGPEKGWEEEVGGKKERKVPRGFIRRRACVRIQGIGSALVAADSVV